jgi:hypothetical protein
MIASLKHIHIAPLAPEDGPWAHALELASLAEGYQLFSAGEAPFDWDQMWTDAFQIAVSVTGHQEPAALVTIYGHGRKNRTAHMSVVAPVHSRKVGILIGGCALILDELFCTWNLRRVYLEANSLTEGVLGRLVGTVAHEEARLRDYYLTPAGPADKVVLTIRQDEWLASWHDFVATGRAGGRIPSRQVAAELRRTGILRPDALAG